ncbi:autoinducer 2 ABC transporter substrate-binding protein LsrB [candidate division KSB3 bacterium]|uniref:Autoinducer 2-binding protein LsrB n=1 Tax=candidate division KSB3 bacterium TaxID=2044937 RepID=A0A2G6E2V8_9BACT|nr:MAG: autoinducer 2 ABC transporter substrate-binding protein LsrB [candidate division KSB3 bacterium]PIE28896.1 MAG: autoinducer 2 ABC transporter substrate-binding protein LsrB [candidate division KSB3 bacterium]
MKKLLILLLTGLTLLSCVAGASAEKNFKIAFIPKIIGNTFFEVAGEHAVAMGEELGVEVKYDGPAEASVAAQVKFINTFVNMGYDAIVVSALDPKGLNQALKRAMDRGVVVVTWDSDVDPDYRTFYVNQGTPDLLGRQLVDMVVNQLGTWHGKLKVAFHYSSPTVTDQNSWVNFAKKIIAEEYPEWEIVTTQYSDMNFPNAVSVGEQILKTYPDVNAIICPDSTAFPGQAKAVENLNMVGKVAVVGFTTPSTIKQYIERGTVLQGGLWDCGVQGAAGVYTAYKLLQGESIEVGGSFEIPGIPGQFHVVPNSMQGGELYERPKYEGVKDNGIILLPERLIFTRYNVDKYDF